MIYLSVVIPVRNEERFIASTLEALIAQEYPRECFELIVVDGRSTDDTVEVVERVMRANPGVNITLLDNPRRWSSVARNIGAKHASGKIVAVVDGHVNIPGRELFSSIERAREEKGALCLARPAPLDRSITPESKGYWIALARKNRLGHSGASYIYSDFEGMVDPLSSGFAYDRELFEQVGYFDESFDAAEDVEFHQRLKAAGVMAYTSPSLSIPYFPRESLHGLFRQMWRYGLGRFRLCRKFPAALSPETLVPPAFLLGLVFWIASLLLAPGSTVAVALSLIYLLYFGIVGYEAFREVGERARGKTLFVMTALFVIHAGLGAGFLMGAAEWARDRYKVPLKDEGEKMKVAFVIDRIDSTTAGTERHLTDLIQNLDKGRFVPVLCLLQETEWSRGYQGCGTHIIGVSSFLKPSTYMRILSFARFLRRERVDIVQSYFADGNKVGIIASFLAGVRARVSMRRNQGYWHTRAERAWLKLINPFATLFLANSEGTRQWAAETEGIPIEKIGVIYNGLELGLFSYAGARARSELRSQWGVADSEYVVGIVANLRPVKRIDVFLEAAARVASKVEDVRFVIAGEG